MGLNKTRLKTQQNSANNKKVQNTRNFVQKNNNDSIG
jgi:hypothetical protein